MRHAWNVRAAYVCSLSVLNTVELSKPVTKICDITHLSNFRVDRFQSSIFILFDSSRRFHPFPSFDFNCPYYTTPLVGDCSSGEIASL